MNCSFCRRPLTHVHGHGACTDSSCPMFGQNQAPCCEGEVACTTFAMPTEQQKKYDRLYEQRVVDETEQRMTRRTLAWEYDMPFPAMGERTGEE